MFDIKIIALKMFLQQINYYEKSFYTVYVPVQKVYRKNVKEGK